MIKMENKKLINWCLENLEFNNNAESWEDTYIVDIIKGYDGTCYTKDGKIMTYNKIRNMFDNEREEED